MKIFFSLCKRISNKIPATTWARWQNDYFTYTVLFRNFDLSNEDDCKEYENSVSQDKSCKTMLDSIKHNNTKKD